MYSDLLIFDNLTDFLLKTILKLTDFENDPMNIHSYTLPKKKIMTADA